MLVALLAVGCHQSMSFKHQLAAVLSTWLYRLFGLFIFLRTLLAQSTYVWSRSHMKTFERADFDLFTRPKMWQTPFFFFFFFYLEPAKMSVV